MGDGKRLSWVEEGLDQKDRIQKNDHKDRISKENDATRKIRERVQTDEQTKINNYSEGFCYGCNKTDKILSTLIYACSDCMEKRGVEGVMCINVRKHNWELCDICGIWKFDDVSQINISFCDSCMKRMFRIHKAYKAKGGRASAPDEIAKRKYYGKDMNEILGTGVTRDQTKSQSIARAGK